MSPPGYPSAWLLPGRARFRFAWQSYCSSEYQIRRGHGLCRLPTKLALPTCFLQLAIPRGVDLLLASSKHVGRSYESDRAVQPHGIVVFHIALNQPPRILRREWRSRPDAFSFERFVPALD